MHMADALVSPAVAATMCTCSAAVAAYSINKMKEENDVEKVPVMGVMGAFVFAAQMINFTIPGTGASGHLCGSMLLAAVLGPYTAFLTMIGVLVIQCLLFADGGLLAVGCNIWNMAFYGCFLGYFLFWRWAQKGVLSRKKIIFSSIAGTIITLQLGAFSVVVETWASRITSLPFLAFAAVMQPIHLAIGLVEGMITASVLLFIYEARPGLLEKSQVCKKKQVSLKKIIAGIVLVTLITASAVSLTASVKPDGLEWSVERITGSTEVENGEDNIYEIAAQVQSVSALLPDYGFKSGESMQGTSFSGVLGAVMVLAVCVGSCYILRFSRKKRER